MADGHLNKCKSCAKKDVHKRYLENIDYIRDYDKSRNMKPHRVLARKKYRSTHAGKISVKRAQINYRKTYPLKYYAHRLVWKAIRDGKIKKGCCEICGKKKSQAHHDDYTKPLKVRWLCIRHHVEWHRENKAKF